MKCPICREEADGRYIPKEEVSLKKMKYMSKATCRDKEIALVIFCDKCGKSVVWEGKNKYYDPNADRKMWAEFEAEIRCEDDWGDRL